MARKNGRQDARGHWRCCRCGESFPWTPENVTHFRVRWGSPHLPLSWCRGCESYATAQRITRRAMADPAWYDAELRAWARDTKRVRAERARRMRQERAQIGIAAWDWLASRGLWHKEITALAGVEHRTVQAWRRGAKSGVWEKSVDRLVRVMRAASDLPAWEGSTHWRHRARVHPAMATLRARLEAAS